MTQFLRISLLFAIAVLPSFALAPFNISCQKGAQTVMTSAIPSSTRVQQSYAGATVTVFIHGGAVGVVSTSGTAVTWVSGTQFNANSDWNGIAITINSVSYTITTVTDATHLTLSSSAGAQTSVAYGIATAKAPIFSDYLGTTPQANPLTCSASAGFLVYSPNSIVDETFSGTGITVPFTLASVQSVDPVTTIPNWIAYNASIGTAAQQCTAAANANIGLMVSQPMAALPSQSMACPLAVLPGGSIQPGASQVVTISAAVKADPGQKIFDTSLGGSGSILMPAPKQDVWVNWFGTTQPAFTAMIAAVANGAAQPTGVKMRATCGTYTISATITFTSSYQSSFVGSGACTNLTWAGNNSSAMLLMQDNLQSEFRDFRITSSTSAQLLRGIQQQNSGSGARWTASLNRFINIQINGTDGGVTTGVYIGGGTDANNDQQYFESVAVQNYSHSGFTINHSQIYDVTFKKCQFAGNGQGAIGVENLAGNFHWEGGTSGGNTNEDFLISGVNSGTYSITDARFEGSAQLLVTGGPSYNNLAITLRGVNYSADKLGCTAMQISGGTCPSPAPGGNAIDYKFMGPLVIDNCVLGTTQLVPLTIALQGFGAGNPNYASIRATSILGSLTTVAQIFPVLPTSVTDSYAFNPNTDRPTTLMLGSAVTPITIGAGPSFDVTNAPFGQIFLTPTSGTTSYTTITGPIDGQFFFVAVRNSGDGKATFTCNGGNNIQCDAGISPVQVKFENTAAFVCFSGVCSLVTRN